VNWFARKWDTFCRLASPRRRREREFLDPQGALDAALADSRWAAAIDDVMSKEAPNLGAPDEQVEFDYPADPRFAEGDYHRYMLGRYAMAARLVEGMDVADFCSGLGWGSYLLSQSARSVTAIEINSRAVRWAEDAWRRDNLAFVCADALDAPLAGRSFGAVCAFECLEHMDRGEAARFIRAMPSFMAPGGLLIGTSQFVATERDAQAVLAAGPKTHRFIPTVAQARELFWPHFREFEIVDGKIFKGRRR